jgi:hypothetical protein
VLDDAQLRAKSETSQGEPLSREFHPNFGQVRLYGPPYWRLAVGGTWGGQIHEPDLPYMMDINKVEVFQE